LPEEADLDIWTSPFNLRCITACLNLGPDDWEERFKQAFLFLSQARGLYQSRGYTVQMIRVATNPFPEYVDWASSDPLRPIKALCKLCDEKDITLSIGPLMQDDSVDPRLPDLFFRIMTETTAFSSIVLTGENGRIHHPALGTAALVIARLAELKPMANFHFAATAGIPADTPFFPAAFHAGATDTFTLGTEAASLVSEVFKDEGSGTKEASGQRLAARFGEEFRRLEESSLSLAGKTGWRYGGIDTSPAPMKEVSIGRAIECLSGVPFGEAGTLSACALITSVIKNVPVKQAGYCGLMLPVMEDEVLARRAEEGRYGLFELLNYSAVCGTGLDVIPLPGTVTEEGIGRLLGDLAALSTKLSKPLSARLIPIPGMEAGDPVTLDSPYLVPTTVFDLK
jgi:uncharacterized protein (UPF0210 family)